MRLLEHTFSYNVLKFLYICKILVLIIPIQNLFLIVNLDQIILNKLIMPGVFILSCIYALVAAYRDLMRAKGPKHIPIF